MKLKLSALAFLLSVSSFAQLNEEAQKKRLDSLFDALAVNKMSMGSVSIYKNGKEFYSKTYGCANIKNKLEIPASEQTMYRIGSISKVFTAYLIMKLAEEGKLKLNNTMSSYFPSLKNAKDISISQMLRHKSLLPIYHKVDDLEKLRRKKSVEELITLINKSEANTDTTKEKYNNLNYILLGLVIEKVAQKPYNEVLQESLKELPGFKAYGTYHYLDHSKNEANSFHIDKEGWVEDFENTEWPLSDGSGFLLSNAQSLNEFMNALSGDRLLQHASVEQMLPARSMFGFGLMKSNYEKHKGYGHTGRIEGFTCATTCFPDDKICVSFLQNGSVYPMNDILILIANTLFDKKTDPLPNLKKMELPVSDKEKMTGTYVNTEEGYKVIVDLKDAELRLRVAKGSGLLNKAILQVYALEKTRLFNPRQGIIFDLEKPDASGKYTNCIMRVNGAKLNLVRGNK
jgi:CubicO group peptidase (beta-lactamase class C family)